MPRIAASRTATGSSLASRAGETTLRATITERVAPGVVYTTFHHPMTQANVVTTEYSDWATNCPEYKVTAVQVSPSNGPTEWQVESLARDSRRSPGRDHSGGMRRVDAARLIAMANQIAALLPRPGEAAVIAGVEDHLRKFWDPRMRREIAAAARAGATDFAPGVREAVKRLAAGPIMPER